MPHCYLNRRFYLLFTILNITAVKLFGRSFGCLKVITGPLKMGQLHVPHVYHSLNQSWLKFTQNYSLLISSKTWTYRGHAFLKPTSLTLILREKQLLQTRVIIGNVRITIRNKHKQDLKIKTLSIYIKVQKSQIYEYYAISDSLITTLPVAQYMIIRSNLKFPV